MKSKHVKSPGQTKLLTAEETTQRSHSRVAKQHSFKPSICGITDVLVKLHRLSLFRDFIYRCYEIYTGVILKQVPNEVDRRWSSGQLRGI